MQKDESVVRPNIDYKTIVESLVEASNFTFSSGIVEKSWIVGSRCLREFKTVGFIAPRQMGKSRFIEEWIASHPDDQIDVIVINKDLPTGHIHRPYDWVNVTVLDPADIRRMIKQNTRVLRRAAKPSTRVKATHFTLADGYVRKSYGEIRDGAPAPKWVLVDDASSVFSYHGIKRSGFYDMYAQDLPNDELPIVILIG